jgi:hypothetical protein
VLPELNAEPRNERGPLAESEQPGWKAVAWLCAQGMTMTMTMTAEQRPWHNHSSSHCLIQHMVSFENLNN